MHLISEEFKNIAVFDIETMGNINSQNFVDEMEITVVGVYFYNQDVYKTYFKEDLPELEKELKNTDLLVGFNNDHFDTPILNKYYKIDLFSIPSFDILREFRIITGKRVGLNSIAGATLGMYKSGSGRDAMIFYQEGKMEELAQYCLYDVRLTKDVFEYAIINKQIKYTSRDGWLRFSIDFDYDIDKFILYNKKKSQSLLV